MNVQTETKPLETIEVDSEYVDLSDFRQLEPRIVKAIKEGKHVVVDLTKARKGARGDIYGELFQEIQKQYANDAEAFDAAQSVTLRFSPNSPAYESMRCGYEGLFPVEFK